MRVSGHTYSFRSLPVDQAIGRLASLGFGEIEVWLGHVEEGADAARQAIDQHGVGVAAVGAGGVYAPGDDRVARAAAVARQLGATVVVTCAAPELVPALPAAAGPGLTVALENHWYQALDRSRRVAEAVDGAPGTGACLDTGHAILAGEPPAAGIAALGSRLAHVHLKEARFPSPPVRALGRRARRRLLAHPAPVFPGEGDLDVAAVREALAHAGFAGAVSFEHEGPEPERALATLLERWAAQRL